MPVPPAARRLGNRASSLAASLGAWLGAKGAAWASGDALLAGFVALFTLARWPDRAHWLTTWDSASFALALQDYDVRALRPHAPGYPLYIVAANAANWFAPDANTALVGLSLACMAAAGVLLYLFIRRIGTRRAALAASLLLVAAPSAYTNSVIAANYTADAVFSIAVAWLAWECRHHPTPRRAAALAIVFAIGLGVRQSLLFYLAPVAVWGVWRGPWDLRVQLKRLGPAIVAAGVVVAAWFIPMVLQSGGLAPWRRANDMQTRDVVFVRTAFNAGWDAVAENGARVLLYLRTENAVVLPLVAVLFVAAALMARRLPHIDRAKTSFCLLWALPSLAFFVLVFSGYGDGPSGYILVTLPALYAAAALLVDAAWTAVDVRGLQVVGVAALVAIALPVQAAAWDDPVDFDWHAHDDWATQWNGIRDEFPANTTVILTWWSSAHVWAYYPDYVTYSYVPLDEGPGGPPITLLLEVRDGITDQDWYEAATLGPDPALHPLPPGARHIILWDFELAGENGYESRLDPDLPVIEHILANGWRILLVATDPDRPNIEGYIPEPLNRPRTPA